MALRIEKAFGPRMDALPRRQTAYEIAEIHRRECRIKLRNYVPGDVAARRRHALAEGRSRNV